MNSLPTPEAVLYALVNIKSELPNLIGHDWKKLEHILDQKIHLFLQSNESKERMRISLDLLRLLSPYSNAREKLQEEIQKTSRVRKIICPHCQNVHQYYMDVSQADSSTNIVRLNVLDGVLNSIKIKLKNLTSDVELNSANAWVDMPQCPNCANVYRYNVLTGETKA